jgi:hypothetical protein
MKTGALALLELKWEELIILPSRRTVEPFEQAEGGQLPAAVAQRGCVDNDPGVRVTRTGRRQPYYLRSSLRSSFS